VTTSILLRLLMSPSDPARRFFPRGRRPIRPFKAPISLQIVGVLSNGWRCGVLDLLIDETELSAAEMAARLQAGQRSVVDRTVRELTMGGFLAVRSLVPSGRPTGPRVRRHAFVKDVVWERSVAVFRFPWVYTPVAEDAEKQHERFRACIYSLCQAVEEVQAAQRA
jgi:hypothetical protein